MIRSPPALLPSRSQHPHTKHQGLPRLDAQALCGRGVRRVLRHKSTDYLSSAPSFPGHRSMGASPMRMLKSITGTILHDLPRTCGGAAVLRPCYIHRCKHALRRPTVSLRIRKTTNTSGGAVP
jgi:hypothetical protein